MRYTRPQIRTKGRRRDDLDRQVDAGAPELTAAVYLSEIPP